MQISPTINDVKERLKLNQQKQLITFNRIFHIQNQQENKQSDKIHLPTYDFKGDPTEIFIKGHIKVK